MSTLTEAFFSLKGMDKTLRLGEKPMRDSAAAEPFIVFRIGEFRLFEFA
jgi:hypothetical protein